MIRLGPLPIAGIAAVALAACDSTTCSDPARAAFASGVANIVSGCYAREERRLAGDLEAAQARRAVLQAEADALEVRAASLSREQQSLVRRIAASQRELAELSLSLDRLARTHAAPGGEVVSLRRREAAQADAARTVLRPDAPLDDRAMRALVERLEAENRHLAAQINTMLRDLARATR